MRADGTNSWLKSGCAGEVESISHVAAQELLQRVEAAIQLDCEWRDRDAAFAEIEERIGRLNERDRETLQLILAGESNKSMAVKLFLSERAIELRRAAIMRKLNVQSLAELLELAVTHRILDELRQAKRRFPKL